MPNSFDHLLTRTKDKLKSLKSSKSKSLILSSSSDYGVSLNGGRAGARFAPQAILHQFGNLQTAKNDPNWAHIEVANQALEKEDFRSAQEKEIENLQNAIKENSPKALIHLGGGHDHIYPLLMALSQDLKGKKIHVVNIDAHLDTRTDSQPSSGTPFRQYQAKDPQLKITQVGIHRFANHESNYQKMKDMRVISMNEFRDSINDLKSLIPINKDELTLFSLDCDALESSFMSAVSAPNHNGMSISELQSLMKHYLQSCSMPILGIYEYNPLFEDLSCKGSRMLAALMLEFYKA